jgi:urea transport system permease protein
MSEATLATRHTRTLGGDDLAALGVAVLLALIPAAFPGYVVYVLPQYMLFGVLAMSLALLWGRVGILSFGQAAFFALGGYVLGIIMKQTWPVNPAYIGLATAMASAALVAALVGWFLFSAGVVDAYFVLVTLALSIIAEQIAVGQSQWTGGWNGFFVSRMELTFGGLAKISFEDDLPAYYAVLVLTTAVYLLLRFVVRSRFGKILVGIRENEARMLSLGINTALYKTAAFALSGAVAAFAGSIYAMHSGFVSPSLGGVLFSTEVVVWVAVAGRASLLAALLGGIAISSLSNFLSAITPQYWQLCIGIIFIATIAYFRGGIAGSLERFFGRARRGRA